MVCNKGKFDLQKDEFQLRKGKFCLNKGSQRVYRMNRFLFLFCCSRLKINFNYTKRTKMEKAFFYFMLVKGEETRIGIAIV